MAKIEISISLVLVNLIVFDFSNLSANWPEKPENNKNGRMNIPAIKDTSERSEDEAIFTLLNVMASISANLKILSFSAPKNCVIKIGANLRLESNSNCFII